MKPCYVSCPDCAGCDDVGCAAAAPNPSAGVIEQGAASCACFPANDRCPSAARCEAYDFTDEARHIFNTPAGGVGHPEYLKLLEELRALHKTKSGGYGTDKDPMANYTAISDLTGQPRYVYPVHRSIEKLARALSLIAQGRVGELEEEFLDTASSLLCAAAMLREDA